MRDFFLICKISRESWDAEVCERVSGKGWEGWEGGDTASLRSGDLGVDNASLRSEV